MYIFQALVYFDGFSSHLHGSFLHRCHVLLHRLNVLYLLRQSGVGSLERLISGLIISAGLCLVVPAVCHNSESRPLLGVSINE